MELIRKNFTLKLLAVSLAVVGWAYIKFAGPTVAAHFKGLIAQPTAQPCASSVPSQQPK